MNKGEDFIIKVPLSDQLKDTEDESWADRTCGICAIKMLMAFSSPKFYGLKIMEMVAKALAVDGYLEGVGWKHWALVKVAGDYGIPMDYQKLFYYGAEKEKGVRSIDKSLKNGQPVIASVYYGFNPEKGGHLVVVHGYRKSGRVVDGYFIQDPYPTKKGNNYYVTREEFLQGWRGGLIWLIK